MNVASDMTNLGAFERQRRFQRPVSDAERLAALLGATGDTVLVTETVLTRLRAPERFALEPRGEAELRGKAAPVKLFAAVRASGTSEEGDIRASSVERSGAP